MSKFQLKKFFKAAYELILVFLQFFIIILHFFQWEFLPQKQIIQASPFSYFLGILIIIIAFMSSIKLSFTGAHVGCIRNTSQPLIDC